MQPCCSVLQMTLYNSHILSGMLKSFRNLQRTIEGIDVSGRQLPFLLPVQGVAQLSTKSSPLFPLCKLLSVYEASTSSSVWKTKCSEHLDFFFFFLLGWNSIDSIIEM